MATYQEKLKDPRWQKVRLGIWSRADFKCENCGRKDRSLEVHHTYYERGLLPWDYPPESLALLCEQCHDEWHALKTRIDKTLAGRCALDLERMLALLQGNVAAWDGTDVQIKGRSDALSVCGIIRGFWAPIKYQQSMIDTALLWLSHGKTFRLSELVSHCIPLHDPMLGFLADWYDNATGGS